MNKEEKDFYGFIDNFQKKFIEQLNKKKKFKVFIVRNIEAESEEDLNRILQAEEIDGDITYEEVNGGN